MSCDETILRATVRTILVVTLVPVSGAKKVHITTRIASLIDPHLSRTPTQNRVLLWQLLTEQRRYK